MPQVNLSDLSGPDLRRLLDATRGRGDAALSYTILQEMAARREGRGQRGLFLMRRPAEPRVVAMDLGDPMEREDDLPPMPHWRQPLPEPETSASPRPEPTPLPGPVERRSRRRKSQTPPTEAPAAVTPDAAVDVESAPLETQQPPSAWDADANEPPDAAPAPPDRDLRLHASGPEIRRAPRGLRRGLAAGFAVGIAVGATLGWWAAGTARDAPSPPAAPAAGPMRTAALARRPAPAPTPAAPIAAEPERTAEAAPDPTVAAPPDPREGAAAPPDAVEVAGDADGQAIEPPPVRRNEQAVRAAETPRAVVASSESAGRNACAAEPTPADRKICGSPELRGLQRELRQAYAEALDAHADRSLLRQRQLAWRSARDTVSDPERLALLYEQRIRKLNAATAAARRQR